MHSAKRTTLGVTKLALPIVALSFLLFASIRTQLSPTRNDVHIDPSTVFLAEGSQDFSIAVLSDMHIRNNEGSYRQLEEVVEDILESKPDLLVILGDFTSEISREDLKEAHRKQVAERLKPATQLQHAIVLGNHDYWDNGAEWRAVLSQNGLRLLKNEIFELPVAGQATCLRGLGDFYSKNYKRTEFPQKCASKTKITITHDPAAAFQEDVSGFVLAGHTHCGQIALPFLGALWAPTEAPREAWCGLFRDTERAVWTTSGIGTSILPVRFEAPSQWDLLHISRQKVRDK